MIAAGGGTFFGLFGRVNGRSLDRFSPVFSNQVAFAKAKETPALDAMARRETGKHPHGLTLLVAAIL